MKTLKILFWILALALSGATVFGQTPRDLQSKYGIPNNVFEIRPGVLMTVKYGDDGEASEMIVEGRYAKDAVINLHSTLPDTLVDELIDELVPVKARGKRIDKSYLDKWYLESNISGTLIETNRRYENYVITLIGNLSPSPEGGGTMVLIIRRIHLKNTSK